MSAWQRHFSLPFPTPRENEKRSLTGRAYVRFRTRAAGTFRSPHWGTDMHARHLNHCGVMLKKAKCVCGHFPFSAELRKWAPRRTLLTFPKCYCPFGTVAAANKTFIIMNFLLQSRSRPWANRDHGRLRPWERLRDLHVRRGWRFSVVSFDM